MNRKNIAYSKFSFNFWDRCGNIPKQGLLFILGILLILTMNCRTTQLAVPIDSHRVEKIKSKSVKRKFHYFVPSEMSEQKLPVVIVLHGGGGNANGIIMATKISDYAQERGFIAVYPSGVGNRWNDGRNLKNAQTDKLRIDDIQFLKDIKKYFVQNHNADPNHFYLTGFSNGGFMVTRSICDTKELFSGFAALGAGISTPHYPKCKNPDKKPILFIWGEKDDTVPFNGGEMIVKNNQDKISVGFTESYETSVDHFADRFSCESKNTVPMKGMKDRSKSAITKTIHSNCKPFGYVEGYALKNHAHTWPGGFYYKSSINFGYDGDDLNASDVVVDFFHKNWIKDRIDKKEKESKSMVKNR